MIERSSENIVTFTFNRPEARNALNWELQNAFLAAVKTLSVDPTVRALILTGAGDQAFCSGGDLVELAGFPTEADGARVTAVMGEALDVLENAPFPTIAAINGYALGGGSEIALACDLRIMDARAKMGLVQVKMGLTPGWGAGQRLLRVAGYSRALHLLLSGDLWEPEPLLQMGVINQIASPGTALETARNLARKIASWDQSVVEAVKRVLRYGLTLPYDEAQAAERAEFPALWAADAHLQAVAAFLKQKK